VLREREFVLFRAVVRAGLAAAPDAFARDADGLRVLVLRVALPVALLARVEVERVEVERFAVERFAVLFRAPVLRAPVERPEELALCAPPSSVHFPDITRCAASATASAMIEPSFVALDIMLVAAALAVSAASRPASRILRRADGLALIAAAAAASPAASISLLIAAFAILSVMSLELVEPDELFREDLAIADLPRRQKDSQCRNGSRMTRQVREFRSRERANLQTPDMLKGTAGVIPRCPSTWSAAGDVAVRQHLGPANTPFRPPC
jgi:hypothetical protein